MLSLPKDMLADALLSVPPDYRVDPLYIFSSFLVLLAQSKLRDKLSDISSPLPSFLLAAACVYSGPT